MTTVPTGGLFEYTRRPIFVSTSVHGHCMFWVIDIYVFGLMAINTLEPVQLLSGALFTKPCM
jgi:hypothetical protein